VVDRKTLFRLAFLGCGFMLAAAALPNPAGAKTYTVGVHGTYPSLGAALAAAAADPGVADVRLEAGWYGEFGLDATVTAGRELWIRGGWDRRFSRRTDDPAATVLDAQRKGRILQVLIDSGKLTVQGLTFRGALIPGAYMYDGALVVQGYGGEAVVERCAFVENRNLATNSYDNATGAALVFWTMMDADYRALDNVFRDNRAEATAGFASAPAIFAISLGGTVEVSRNLFQGNVARSDAETISSVGYVQTQWGEVVFDDNVILDNTASGPATSSFWRFQGAINLAVNGTGTIDARRNLFLANHTSPDGSQLVVNVWAQGRATISDSLVAGSPDGGGLDVWVDGEVNVVNCTIADNVGGNVRVDFMSSNGRVSIANSIVHGSQTSPGGYQIKANGPIKQSKNLVGVDPSFVDPAGGDYRLRPNSPAIDFGNPGPAGGLGPLDLDRTPRVLGSQVDAGAYEFH
jgi:hypothetical protein